MNLMESPTQNKKWVRIKKKPNSLLNQSIHIQLQIESKSLSSTSEEQAFQSDFSKSSQESQVGMPLSASR